MELYLLKLILISIGILAVVSESTGYKLKKTNCDAAIDNKVVWTNLGREARVLCKAENPHQVHHCYWKVYSSDNTGPFILNVTSDERDANSIQPGYSYFGKGLTLGECGVLIEDVKKKDLGRWECTLLTQKVDVCSGIVNVSQWVKPQFSPAIDTKEKVLLTTNLTDTKKVNVSCCAQPGGVPKPSLHFTLADDGTPVEGHIQSYTKPNEETCIQWIDALFPYDKNGKTLRCLMEHVSLDPDDIRSDSVRLNVSYPPRLDTSIKEAISISGEAGSFKISVTVLGNPEPTGEWSISKGDSDLRTVVNESVSNENFETDVQNPDPKAKEAKTVHSFTILDIQKMTPQDIIYFQASNAYGEAELKFSFQGGNDNLPRNLFIILGGVIGFLAIGALIIFIVWRVRTRSHRVDYPVTKMRGVSWRNPNNRAPEDKKDSPDEPEGVAIAEDDSPAIL